MATLAMVGASIPRARAAKDPKALGPVSIGSEIQRLCNNGLYALPVSVSWDQNSGSKQADFPRKYAHIKDTEAWRHSINQTMKEKRDANGLAILAGVSGVYVIDVDVAAKGGKRPGIELWQQLVEIHGEPETLKARTGSGGLHLYFKLDSPGLTWRRNFQGLKVDDETFCVDGRGIGGVVFASPTSYSIAYGKLATYEWINGPPSYEACHDMPTWLAKLVNNRAGHSGPSIEEEEGGKDLGAPIDAPITGRPVDQYDDMHVITRYTRGSQETQDLLLQIVKKHAAPQAYANLGRLFAYLYMIEGRILVTTNEAERSRDQLFFVWDGTSWVQDTSNLVSSVFISQMGCLLAWYDRQRERCLGTLYASRPELEGFVVDGVPKPPDPDQVNPKQMRKIKMAMETCAKELDKIMPSFGRINVQDVADVRKCLHSVVIELHVNGLLDKFDQDPTVANAPNGLIDLQTGALLPHRPQNLCINQTTRYVRGASARSTAKFRTFLMDILPPRTIEWLQMFLGYGLTEETLEELFVIMNGNSGSNGKGFPQERGGAILIRTIDGKKRLRGFFGIRLKTKEELERTDAQGNLPKAD
ncbi:hypothetical protein KFL_012860020 [Klebsormidium nitens]|uniref:DNA primase/polymerase bifunctional N-terminal domain-containing protein n=1 Tax=Klebsormidium nitens TaxID=105231 RepID=A0A1Y1IXR1_KLENI|nr:hypothetical protein KFL_012860020 [Klebsormidium nitens]|eukprot:GAQ93078.1 hypothetical protein KFL_012860020 [Klebsormidium nitens]